MPNEAKTWQNITLTVAIITVSAIVAVLIINLLIGRLVNASVNRAKERSTERTGRAAVADDTSRAAHRIRTLGQALKLISTWAIIFIAFFMTLHELGFNTAPLLASAGIGGIAIGLGAQSLIKDIFGGVFLILEDQFGIGDYVIIGELKGVVQSIGVRVTRIQDSSGAVWYVRNGEISTLGNQSQGWSSAYVKLPVALTEDPFKVIRVLESVTAELEHDPQWHNQMLEPPSVQGLSAFDSAEMIFQVQLKCPANKQWTVERELRARALLAFQHAGIKTPIHLVNTPGLGVFEIPEDSATTNSEKP
ncbi:MAG: mechanosensitive ion channel family protein [Propionibacteriaceae bacterium]|jgi:small conductance mechanosensitive channel|nr:mechanosensitive ion channel family protein [Propionibacteriaceae bacterium]